MGSSPETHSAPDSPSPAPNAPSASSAQDRLEAAYEAMQGANAQINAVIDVFNDTAITDMLDADERAENGRTLGAVDGMPVAVAASVAVEGRFHHAGCKAYASRRAEADAVCVTQLRAGGAVITGTLNMGEGGLVRSADNPWFGAVDGAAGTAAGAAAAVAAGFCEAALALDTVGEVGLAAAGSAVWSLVPSRVEALLDGVVPVSPSLDSLGVVARSRDAVVAVAQTLLDQDLGGGQPGAVVVLDAPDGVPANPAWDALTNGLDRASLPGLAPFDPDTSLIAAERVCEVDAHAHHADRWHKAPGGFGEAFAARLQSGADASETATAAARAHLAAMRDARWPDFVLMPAGNAALAAAARLADRPALVFPIGDDGEGAAVLVGPPRREADLVATLRAWLPDG